MVVDKPKNVFLKKTYNLQTLTFPYEQKEGSYDFGVNFSNVVQVLIYQKLKSEYKTGKIQRLNTCTANSKWSFFSCSDVVVGAAIKIFKIFMSCSNVVVRTAIVFVQIFISCSKVVVGTAIEITRYLLAVPTYRRNRYCCRRDFYYF